ncbi:MAG: metallophosphoesterase family protein [Cyclobacteriaceae bacterium]|nr:metallophosphoesterase family protein [Cyclobacteriaceae bacterium]
MVRIGLLSDTHSWLDEKIFEYFSEADEIWHAGDIGDVSLAERLESFKPLRAVYGNIDGGELRARYPADQIFTLAGVSVWMTHIGGYPPNYNAQVKKRLNSIDPELFICGHSHILKIMPDTRRPGMLYINPGAAGIYGFHIEKTIVRFDLDAGSIRNMEVIKLGKRAKI